MAKKEKFVCDRKKFIGGKEASQKLGVHQRTLYNWEDKGLIETIRTPGGKRLYNVESFIKKAEVINLNKNLVEKLDDLDCEEKIKIIYARVSSHGQKEDLERQKRLLIKNYPNHKLIEDIGSGINFNRRGFRKIVDLAIEGKVEELVVVHEDRLCRFGYDLIEDLIKDYSGGVIKVMKKEKDQEPEEELIQDVLQIMNVFVAKKNGLRRYKNKKKSGKK